MHGLMMDVPLTLTAVMQHAERVHGDAEVVSRDLAGTVARTTYADLFRRANRLAEALAAFGLEGDRVGTLGWNSARHLELYFGVSCAGFVCHTINPRLSPDQIAFIVHQAQDKLLFVDPQLVGLLEPLGDALSCVKAVVVMTDQAGMPPTSAVPAMLCYEDLLEHRSGKFAWPTLDEKAAAALCYTSGTTGDPKGVLYSHRSSVLHAMSICMPDVFGISGADTLLPVVPMFHVAAWGMPYAAPMVGAKLVLPGPRLDGASLHGLITSEGVTCTAGVPTVWMGLLDWADSNGADLKPLDRVGIGGSACPPALAKRFAARGIEVVHAWGMTETSPVALANRLKPRHRALPPDELAAHAARQGRPIFGVEARVVDDAGATVPPDGESVGTLLVRGPWVADSYFGGENAEGFAVPGWFSTGDVVRTMPDGTVEIVDRTKDVIKSGGEWISSIHLESVAAGHPAVKEAAAIAVPDATWGERPLLAVVLREGTTASEQDLLGHFEGKVVKWAIPTRVVVVEALPHTATGKVSKRHLRAMLG